MELALNQQANIRFSMEKEMRIISAVKRVEFVSDRMSYIIPHWGLELQICIVTVQRWLSGEANLLF
jgi:hypothetical protein